MRVESSQDMQTQRLRIRNNISSKISRSLQQSPTVYKLMITLSVFRLFLAILASQLEQSPDDKVSQLVHLFIVYELFYCANGLYFFLLPKGSRHMEEGNN